MGSRATLVAQVDAAPAAEAVVLFSPRCDGPEALRMGEARAATAPRLDEREPADRWYRADRPGVTVLLFGHLYADSPVLTGDETVDGRRDNPAEAVAAGYSRWGVGVLSRLRGNFAIVIHDASRGRLLAVRDPLGVVPLFYTRDGEIWRFCCSLETLVQSCSDRVQLNRAALADHLRHRWPRLEETFFAGVDRVPLGRALYLENGRTSTFRYWDPAPPGEGVRWLEEDVLDAFDQQFDRVVSRCLTDGDVGIYLSGGLDSVSVAAVAADVCARLGRNAPQAFSLIFPDLECNEEKVQRNVAAGLGLSQTILPFHEAAGPRGLLTEALELSARQSAPLLNFWLPAYRYLGGKAVESGCTTILTGTGGDEWLGVTPVLAADLVRRGDLGGLYRLWRSNHRSYEAPRWDMLRSILWTFGLKPVLREHWKRAALRVMAASLVRTCLPGVAAARERNRAARAMPAWLAPDTALKADLNLRLREAALGNSGSEVPESFYLREMRMALDHPLIALEMEETFETGRRLGARMAQPYWDPDLVDLLYRVPPEVLNRGDRSKGLVRESLERRFPNLGFRRQKKAVSTNFFQTILLADAPETWRSMGGPRALTALGIVDPHALERELEALHSGCPGRYAQRVWNVLNLEAWVRSRLQTI